MVVRALQSFGIGGGGDYDDDDDGHE